MKSSIQASTEFDRGWLITLPADQAFTPPQFHFGDLVQWMGEDAPGNWVRKTGRITGMHFTRWQTWQYQVRFDLDPTPDAESNLLDVSYAEADLQPLQSASRIQQKLPAPSEWLTTAQAAQVLGLSAEQLRRLRRKGLFRVNHHCRDTSVPSSDLPRWQWMLLAVDLI